MKIAVIGQFNDTNLGASFSEAFKALGHDVHEIDPLRGMGRVQTSLASDRASRRVGEVVRNHLSQKLLEQVRPADLVFVTKGNFISPGTWPEVRRRSGALLVNFNPDDPFNLNGSSSAPHLVASIPHFDVYFTWASGLLSPLLEAGAKRVGFLPFGVDTQRFFPLQLNEAERRALSSDIAFIGNWDPEREAWLDALRDFKLSIWGESWSRSRSPVIRRALKGPAIYGDSFRRRVAASKIQLNILRAQNKNGHNMRTFELPACRSFVLHEASRDLGDLFKLGEEVETFSNPDELIEKAHTFLGDEARRTSVAQAGHLRAGGHTYAARAAEVLRVTGSMQSTDSPK
jgi:spore maturation protein CgeB